MMLNESKPPITIVVAFSTIANVKELSELANVQTFKCEGSGAWCGARLGGA